MKIYRQQLFSGANVLASANGPLTLVIPRTVVFVLDVSAASGTTPTLDVDIEAQDPVSGSWFVIDTFAQKTAVGNERRVFTNLSEANLRAAFVIGGTTPDFSFTVSVQGKEGDEN